jgi:prepilin-type N-terminal cleavage/methylation domain-containing protein
MRDTVSRGRTGGPPPVAVWAGSVRAGRRGVLWGGLACLVGAMAYSLLWTRLTGDPYVIPGRPGRFYAYRTPADIWCTFDAARYVANGALGYVYEACPTYTALPLAAVLLAPAAALGQAAALTGLPAPEPSLWLLLGPVAMAVAFPLLAGARLAAPAGRIVAAQAVMVVLVYVPVAAMHGHVEDTLAVALVLVAVGLAGRGRWPAAGLAIGLAIASKQLALLALPVLVMAAPAGQRRRLAVAALPVPVLLAGLALAVDWRHASSALLHAANYPAYGHPAPWVDPAAATVAAWPFRLAVVVVAVLVALAAGRRADPSVGDGPGQAGGLQVLLAALGLVLLARAAVEPVLHAYYLGPGLGLLALHELAATGRARRTLAVGLPLLAWFGWHGSSSAVWWTVTAALAAVVALPALGTLRPTRPRGGRAAGVAAAGPEPARADAGFSLIELAVVVVIIAILIAIATPVFLGARARSQDTKAQTTLGYALGAQRSVYADQHVYTTNTTDLDHEVQGAVSWVTTTPAAGTDQVAVAVADLSSSDADQDQLVCLVAVSASGRTFTVKDMAKGAAAGTWYLRGADSGCTTSVTGEGRDWSG